MKQVLPSDAEFPFEIHSSSRKHTLFTYFNKVQYKLP